MKKVMLLAPKNMCDILQAALDDKYITLPCSDPAAAREMLMMNPDALIISLSLPGVDGMTFLQQNVGLLPDTILTLTLYINSVLLHELEAFVVTNVLLIPFRLPYLDHLLSEYL